jgi:hypothetical protein
MLVEPDVSVIVPSFGSSLRCRPLLRRLPLGWFAHFTALTAALRLPAPPPRSRHALTRRFRLTTEDAGSPKFLGDPRHTCPGLRSRRSLPEQASGASPLRLALSVLPSEPPVSSASATNPNFGTQFPQPTCSLSTLRVGRCLPLTQDSLPAGGPALAGRESNPLGHLPGFCLFLAYMTHLQDEACLAHGPVGGAEPAGGLGSGCGQAGAGHRGRWSSRGRCAPGLWLR